MVVADGTKRALNRQELTKILKNDYKTNQSDIVIEVKWRRKNNDHIISLIELGSYLKVNIPYSYINFLCGSAQTAYSALITQNSW